MFTMTHDAKRTGNALAITLTMILASCSDDGQTIGRVFAAGGSNGSSKPSGSGGTANESNAEATGGNTHPLSTPHTSGSVMDPNGGATGQYSTYSLGGASSTLSSTLGGQGGATATQSSSSKGSDDNTVIDDMEAGTGRILTRDQRKGVWYAFAAVDPERPTWVGGTLWPPITSPGVPIETSVIQGGRVGSTHAMHAYGSESDTTERYWYAGIGVDLMFDGSHYGTYDASAYEGITFWIRGNPTELQVRVSTTPTTAVEYGGTCTEADCDPHNAPIEANSSWHQIWVPFSNLKQTIYGPGLIFDPSALTNIQFYCPIGCSSFDFWIDDLAFYKACAPNC
jgi:hypothetical protein